MTDFAAARAAETLDFTDAERREVVMKHKALGILALELLNALIVRRGADCHGDEALRFATRKERGTVNARQQADFASDRTHLIETAAIDADAVIDDLTTHQMIFRILKCGNDFALAFAILFGIFFNNAVLKGIECGIAFELGWNIHRGFRVVIITCDEFDDCRVEFGRFEGFLGFANGFGHAALHGKYVLDGIGTKLHGIEELRLSQAFGLAFDHHDGLFTRDHDDIGVGVFAFGVCGVGDPFAVDTADADTGNRAFPRQVGKHEGCGSTRNRNDIRFIVGIVADDGRDNLDFVVETFGEKRTARAVDQAADERLVLALTAFAASIRARNAARGIHFFDIFASQREEILIQCGRLCAGGHDDDGVATLDHHGTVGLFRDAAGFD